MNVWLPTGYVSGDPVRLLLCCHNAGGSETVPFGPVYGAAAIASAQAAGYMLAAVGTGTGREWGNPASVADYAAAHATLLSSYNVTGTVLWGASMGGLAAATLTANGSITGLRGVLLMVPVLSLASMYADNPAYRTEIDTAYSASSGQGATVAAAANCDPYLRTTSLFAGIPFRMSASDGDTVVNKAHNMDAFAGKITGVTQVTTQTTTGDHGDASNWVWSDFSGWLDARFTGLLITPSAVWSQSGTTVSATRAPRNTRSFTTATVYSASGGPIQFRGTHAARFSVSLDGTTWASTVTVPPGTSTIYLGVTPQAGDTSLTAQIGIPT